MPGGLPGEPPQQSVCATTVDVWRLPISLRRSGVDCKQLAVGRQRQAIGRRRRSRTFQTEEENQNRRLRNALGAMITGQPLGLARHPREDMPQSQRS